MKWDRQMRRCSCSLGWVLLVLSCLVWRLMCQTIHGESILRGKLCVLQIRLPCPSPSTSASKARTCYQTVCKPSLQHLILVCCFYCCYCSCHASSGSAPAPIYCRLSWGSTLALAVIKRLNNASCLIIIYDTRLCRLLPEKPAGIREREGRGGVAHGKIGRRFDLVLPLLARLPCDYLNQL